MIEKFREKANDLKLYVFAEWALSSLVDGVFLVLWVWGQWLIDQVICQVQLSWIDHYTLLMIQVLFAIATLVPIVVHSCVNLVQHVVQGWKAIQEEMKGLGKGA